MYIELQNSVFTKEYIKNFKELDSNVEIHEYSCITFIRSTLRSYVCMDSLRVYTTINGEVKYLFDISMKDVDVIFEL
ncbi:MAG: hypothetical protein J6T10_27185 [Methanobrevibacter sp.]|nr:hypothetical protein [Methanobrevibacter sp.]